MGRDRAADRFPARAWHRVSFDWRGRTAVAGGLAAWVVTGWLLVAGTVALTLPDAASTPAAPPASAPTAGFVAVPGRTARIHQPGMPRWLIPVERRAYDEYDRSFREGDGGDDDHVFTAFEWIQVEHYQAVRIIEIDGEAHHVELLDGRNVGRRGWLKTRHLGP